MPGALLKSPALLCMSLMWRALHLHDACFSIQARLQSTAACSAVLQGKSLQQIERRIARLKAFQGRLKWPCVTSVQAFGRSYCLPLHACAPAVNSAPLQRLQYLAGFFDGDGCVQGDGLTVGQVANNAEILWLFRETFGGGIHKHREGRGLRQPTLTWAACGDRGRLAAAQLLDHSFVKHAQLKIISTLSSPAQARQRMNHTLSKLKGVDSCRDAACSWAYVTGFFDADGAILIAPSSAHVQLQMSQKQPNVLAWMQHFLNTELGYEPFLYQDIRGAHTLVLSARDQVRATLHKLLEHGLLVKRAQAEAALQVDKNSHAIVRGLQMKGKGNQSKYRRLDAAGDQRARQIRMLRSRLWQACCATLSKLDTDLLREQLADLKEVHAYLNASFVHRTIRTDIRRMVAQGAVPIEALLEKHSGMWWADIAGDYVGKGKRWFICSVDDCVAFSGMCLKCGPASGNKRLCGTAGM